MTAGMLWTTLEDDDTFEQGVASIVSQIMHAIPSAEPEAEYGQDNDLPSSSMNEMRAELERLRKEVAGKGVGATAFVRDFAGPCMVPAAVPPVATGIRVSDQMRLLVETVVSPTSQICVGIHGIGGPPPELDDCYCRLWIDCRLTFST